MARTIEIRLAVRDEMSAALRKAGRSAADLAKDADRAGKSLRDIGSGVGKIPISGLDKLAAKTTASADAADKARRKYEDLGDAGTKVLKVGLALGVGVGVVVKRFADFESAMSGVSAATMASVGDVEKLRSKAIELGSDTQYTAREAADGIKEMAKAGVQVSDILNGGLKGALSLATSGQMDVAEAAEIASSAMVQFGLKGADIGHVADLLAAGAGKALGSVKDLGMALGQTGVVANATGLSIEETVGGLAAFASAGLTGSDAGTSFKTMLQRLTPHSTDAAKAMEDLGFSAYDSEGKFVGLATVAQGLQDSMGNLSDEQRNATMTTIFGSDAVRAATILYEQGAGGVKKWTDAVNDEGYAAEQSARLMNNLAGDWDKLGGAIDAVVMRSGGSVNDMLRGMTQAAEGAVDTVGALPQPLLELGTAFGALSAVALVAGGGIVSMVPKIAATRVALQGLTGASAAAAGSLGLLGKAVAVIGAAYTALQLSEWAGGAMVADQEAGKLAGSLQAVATGSGDASAFMDLMGQGMGIFHRGAIDANDAVFRFGQSARLAFSPTFWEGLDVFSQGGVVGEFEEQIKELDVSLAQMVASGNADAAKDSFERLMASVAAQGGNVDLVREKFALYNTSLQGNVAEQQKAADAAMVTAAASAGMTVEVYKAKVGMEEAAKATEDFNTAVGDLGGTMLDQRASMRDYAAAVGAVDAAIKDNGKTLDIHTEAGRKNQVVLDTIASTGTAAAKSILENGGSIEEAAKQVRNTKSAFVEAAVKMGMPIPVAEALATKLGLTSGAVTTLAEKYGKLPKKVSTSLTVPGLATALKTLGELNAGLTAINGRTVKAVVQVVQAALNPVYFPFAASPAKGMLVERYAAGAVERHNAQIAKAGAWRVWAEPETKGESYIPHAKDHRRPRALEIWRQTGHILGVQGFADGGLLSGQATLGDPNRFTGGKLALDIIAKIAKVIPPKAPIPVTFDISKADKTLLMGPELVSLLTGVDLPDLSPAVQKVRDGISKIATLLDGLVESAVTETVTTKKTTAAKTTAAKAAKFVGALGSAKAKPYQAAILAAGIKYGVAPELLAAQINAESGWNPRAVSSAGAKGLAQFMPGTAKSVGLKNPFDAMASITAQAKLMGQYATTYKGDINKMLAAYNAGPGNVGRWSKIAETRGYVNKIGKDAGVSALKSGRAVNSNALAAAKKAGTATGTTMAAAQQAQLAATRKAVASKTSPEAARTAAIANALGMVGKGSYKWGGGHQAGYYKNSAALAADCSGFVGWAVGNALGKNATSTTTGMMNGNKSLGYVKIDPKIAAKTAGAIMGNAGHVVMSMGDGTVVESYSKGKPVRRRAISAKDMKMAAWNTGLGAMTKGTAASWLSSTGAAKTATTKTGTTASTTTTTVVNAAKIAAQTAAVTKLKQALVAAAPYMEDLAVQHANAAENAAKYKAELEGLIKEQNDYAASVASSITAQGELSKLWKQDTEAGTVTSLHDVIAGRRKLVEDAQAFRASINQLKAAGLNADDLRDLIGMGAQDGGRLAKQILAASNTTIIADMNATRSNLQSAGEQIGEDFAGIVYGGQVKAAENVAKAWQDEADGLAKTTWQVGQAMQDELLRGLGLTNGQLGAKTSNLLEQMKAQWMASLGVSYYPKVTTVPANTAKASTTIVNVKLPERIQFVDSDKYISKTATAVFQRESTVQTREAVWSSR